MKKAERYFYLTIIIMQFVMILYSFHLHKKGISREKIIGSDNIPLYSFKSQALDGSNRFFHFTAYGERSYIFVVLSSSCIHCDEFLSQSVTFIQGFEQGNEIEIFFVSADEIGFYQEKYPGYYFLKLSREDIIQFGSEMPVLIAVNGKGQVLFRHAGYYDQVFQDAIDVLTRSRLKRSKPV